jgi:hypothetical protein
LTETLEEKKQIRVSEPPTTNEIIAAVEPNLRLDYMHRESDWTKAFKDMTRFLFEGKIGFRGFILIWLTLITIFTVGSVGPYLFILAAFIAILAGLIFLLDSSMNKTALVIRTDGFVLPMKFLMSARFKRFRSWSDLKLIIFDRDNQPSVDPNRIIMRFNDDSYADFDVYGFNREDLKKLFLCLAIHCPDLPKFPSIQQLNPSLYQIESDKNPLSFTNMWEADLNARFATTAFVPLESGETLQEGKIKVIGQIGFGGFSAVYLAQTDEGSMVALKEAVLPANANEQTKAKAIQMFNKEAQILCTLDHPQIARVFDHFVENGRNYLLLEYVPGINLRTFVRQNGPQPEKVVVSWLGQVGLILQYLQSLQPRVVHRDISPENLMLTKSGKLVLIDFGAANNFLSTATGTFVGKQSYISPEQFRGKAVPASDIYSLGATAYFLLTGEDPPPLSVLRPAEKDSSISPAMNEFVAHCTQQELEFRLLKPKELLAELAAIAQQQQQVLR